MNKKAFSLLIILIPGYRDEDFFNTGRVVGFKMVDQDDPGFALQNKLKVSKAGERPDQSTVSTERVRFSSRAGHAAAL